MGTVVDSWNWPSGMVNPSVSGGSQVWQRVSYIDLGQCHREMLAELLPELERLLCSGEFILGEEVRAFEAEFAVLCGTRYAVAVGNGTEAITLVLRGLGIGAGDEVITAPNSFLASASAIMLAGAR